MLQKHTAASSAWTVAMQSSRTLTLLLNVLGLHRRLHTSQQTTCNGYNSTRTLFFGYVYIPVFKDSTDSAVFEEYYLLGHKNV